MDMFEKLAGKNGGGGKKAKPKPKAGKKSKKSGVSDFMKNKNKTGKKY